MPETLGIASKNLDSTMFELEDEPSRVSRGLRKEDVPSSGEENLRECQHRRGTPTS